MCLAAIAYQSHPEFPLIMISNRDEFYNRPSEEAGFRGTDNQILCGKDLLQGGTWTGVNKDGKMILLTNYRDPELHQDNRNSRGEIPFHFLEQNEPVEAFIDFLKSTASDYNGYNLIFGTSEKLYYFSNITLEANELSPGIYGLSNHLLDTSWPKTNRVKNSLTNHLKYCNHVSFNELIYMMKHPDKAPDHELPATGVPIEWERELSSVFIQSKEYGTRATTVLLVNKTGDVTFIEQNYNDRGEMGNRNEFHFTLS